MSHPVPKEPYKVTYHYTKEGQRSGVDVEIFEFDPTIPDRLKPLFEERKRLWREARERAAVEQQQKSDDAPTGENKPSS